LVKNIVENIKYWLEKVNTHLETLLDKENKYFELQRKMAKYYSRRNQVARSKLKRAHEKIEKLTKQEERRRHDMLAEASLHASNL